ncbi:MAG: response regulator [Anaerolineae bacterium]|nr:response regulator [Anaerolineae bacterium]
MVARVLVIDDASVTRRIVSHTLKSIDVETVGAVDGFEALALAQQEHFDVILVDINLPDIDGFEVIKRLNEIANISAVPKIMFTARNELHDRERAKSVGAAGFLYKPFSTQELRDLVTSHLPAR